MSTLPLWRRTTICGLRALADPSGSGRIVSLVDPDWPPLTEFADWPLERRLELRFDDEIEACNERVLPDAKAVAAILAFGSEMDDPDERLFIHCLSGVSRSPAAALMLWAQAHPEAPTEALFDALAELRPSAWPNSLMLEIADQQLGRRDRLAEAALGYFRGRLAQEDGLEARMRALRREVDVRSALTPGIDRTPRETRLPRSRS